MASGNKKNGSDEAAAVVKEATAAVAGAAAKVKGTETKHSEKARFCIQPLKDGDGNAIGEESFTDSPHVAFAMTGNGHKVIDHKNGNRVYDGTDPSAAKK